MTVFSRLRRALSPRRSLAARLTFLFFLFFLVPGSLIVFILVRRLNELKNNSVQQLTAVRLAQTSMQVREDAGFRAEWMDRRAAVAEEAAWAIATAARVALTSPFGGTETVPPVDSDGHVWNPFPAEDTVAFIENDHENDPEALRDYGRTLLVAPLLRGARERRSSIRNASIWTATGVMRMSPWVDIHEALRNSQGALDSFELNKMARFPEQRPSGGDTAIWYAGRGGMRVTPETRLSTLFVPVRDDSGKLVAAISMDIDARRYVTDALESGEVQGDFWMVADSSGHAVYMTSRAAELLHWRPTTGEALSDTPDPERRRLAAAIFASPRSVGNYRLGRSTCRIFSAKVRTTGWVFVEGLSGAALAKVEADATEEIQPKSYSDLETYVLLVFFYLLFAVLAVVVLASRRISAPVRALVHAAEEIGRGRSVEVQVGTSPDELGRLAAAIDRMGRRVERRVETLRRLHSLFRASYQTTDLGEVLSRASEAIAAFTRAERVWFYLYDADSNRLEAAWPGWNVTQETMTAMKFSVESPSLASMVFKSGEPYVTNDLEHDPYVNRKLQELVHASNAIFCPLKAEDETFGVAVATNRSGGFGHEEVDALTSFADAASLLIKNARLYATLTGTVEELRRASRLKDYFLQNVNHELRTPLTSIVGWTDLLEEGAVDELTMRRGLKQVRQSARVLLALIDDLLDLARMDRGTLSLDLRPVSLYDVAQRSIETVRLMAEARGVVLILAPPPDSTPLVRADALRLQQIVWNLLANSIKFTPRHGRVVVRVEREPERYLVSVEDDGIGIPESDLPHIFERFRQVDGSPTRRHPGMGIGLALVRSLVELHGGTIWAESVVGHGSRFTFSLPISVSDRRTAAATATSRAADDIEDDASDPEPAPEGASAERDDD
jgi:signal transduction histidine kinase/HAMP domain-containing protein